MMLVPAKSVVEVLGLILLFFCGGHCGGAVPGAAKGQLGRRSWSSLGASLWLML